MIDGKVWRLLAVLAFGLGACTTMFDDSPPPRDLAPGGGFKAEAVKDVVAGLKLPDPVSPEAALLQVDLSLENKGTEIETVTVPRACDVYDWVMRDATGKLVMTKDPVACVDQPASKELAPGSILGERVSIYLWPNVMRSGQRYTIEYRFWGQPVTVSFTARKS